MGEKIEKFEDLQCWQAARQLVRIVYLACETGKLSKDFETRWQLKSAALSTMNNIAEGFTRYNRKEFLRFLDYSKSSAGEVKSITYALEDVGYLPMSTIEGIRAQAEKTKTITLGFIRYLNSKA